MDLQPNILNKYQSYSYDIEWRLSPFSIGRNTGADLPPNAGVLIAATGRTANFYIEKVEIEHIPNTTATNLNAGFTLISLEIFEPMGFTFIDRYFSAIKSMGWQQPTEAISYLYIGFNGWNINGSPEAKVHRVGWRLSVADIGIDIDSSGTRYQVSFVIVDFLGLKTSNQVIQRQVRSEIKQTLAESLSELATQVTKTNKADQDASNKGNMEEIVYEFKLGAKLAALNPKMYINQQVGTMTDKTAADGKHYYNVSTGMRIDEMLVKYVLNALNIADHLIPKIKPDGTRDASVVPDGELAKWLNVQSQTSYMTFDPVKGKYKKKITYTIDSQYRPEVETMPPNTDGRVSQAMSLVGHGLLKKRYDYIFTGKNTEVLELKIDFNTLYTQLIATYGLVQQVQTPATDPASRQKEDQDKIARLVPTGLAGGGFGGFGGLTTSRMKSGGPKYLEEFTPAPSFADLISISYAPIGDAEMITDGVGDNSDVYSNNKKIKLAEFWAQAKSVNKLPEYNSVMTSMLEISMTVRGDPYWLAVTDLENNYQNAESNPDDLANFPLGSQYIFLKFRLPETYEINSGLPWNLGRMTFTGIYRVDTMKSIFENGKFSQVLNCVYDMTTNGVDIDGFGMSGYGQMTENKTFTPNTPVTATPRADTVMEDEGIVEVGPVTIDDE